MGRKYRTRGLALAAISSTVLAGLMLVPGAANADPKPTLEQARKQVAELRHQAEVAGNTRYLAPFALSISRCAIAAALSGRVSGNVVAVVSGGNIDLSTFASLVTDNRQ